MPAECGREAGSLLLFHGRRRFPASLCVSVSGVRARGGPGRRFGPKPGARTIPTVWADARVIAMAERNEPLVPGAIVRSRRGKDEDRLAVVIALLDGRFALVADGDKRRFDRPKRKNVLHLEPVGIVSEEVARSLQETGRVTNGKLRHAVADAARRLAGQAAGRREAASSRTGEAHAEEKGE
jgi:ribosomal protein L14E/L6E/L27E